MLQLRESFFEPEVICDYQVSTERKRIWARELEILEAFDAICRKHGLRYWAAYGTLLGAVRHRGFIPWDDDLDLCMPREDYDKAAIVMKEELEAPFEWQDLYTNLSLCTPEEITTHHMLPFAKICNRMTTAISPPAMPPAINQGIWIDIFPFDDGFDGHGLTPEAFQIEKSLCVATFGKPELKEKLLSPDYEPCMDRDDLRAILNLPMEDRFRIFEQTLASVVGVSTLYSYKYSEIFGFSSGFSKTFYEHTDYLPFESFSMPVPYKYHDMLSFWYGDYNKLVMAEGHITIYNTEISYMDYFNTPGKYMDSLKIGVD